MVELGNASNISVGKPEQKRPLGRPTYRWEDNIIDIKEIRWEVVDWTHLRIEITGRFL
jgi:hypothetical protein